MDSDQVVHFCDDCLKPYVGRLYYTFRDEYEDDCQGEDDPEHVCTGNICPDCAGPWLTPNDPADPRKPSVLR